MGFLPPQLALIQTNVNVQALTELPLGEIHELVDLLLEAHGAFVPALN